MAGLPQVFGSCDVVLTVRSMLRRRLLLVVLLAVGFLAGWVTSAGADLPALPTVTLPPLPTVTLPTLPPAPPPPPILPPPPQLPQVPPAPLPPPPAGSLLSKPGGGPSGGGDGAASTSPNGTSASPRGSSRRSGSRAARVYRLHFSRDWISRTGPKKRKHTQLVFVLKRAAVVEFVVVQVAPSCRRIGRFRVAGRAGVNRVRFRGRIGGRMLGPGTYRIRARTVPRGRAVANAKVVIVARPDPQGIASARSADACGSTQAEQSTSSSGSALGKPGATAPPAGTKTEKTEEPEQPPHARGVLGAGFAQNALGVAKSIRPLLFLLLGILGAGLLIGVASVAYALR